MENKELMELEAMEMENNVDLVDYDEIYTDDESGSGNGLGIAVGLAVVGGIAAAAVAGYKKLKAKTGVENKPRKKKKFHIGWVEVEDEPVVDEEIAAIPDLEAEEIGEDDAEK